MMMMRAIDYPITVVFNSGDTAFIILTPYPLLRTLSGQGIGLHKVGQY